MGYYSFFSIIRSILFSLRGIMKYLMYSILLILFIVICLLLMSSSVRAEIYYDNNSQTSVELPDFPENSNEFNNSCCIIFYNPNATYQYTLCSYVSYLPEYKIISGTSNFNESSSYYDCLDSSGNSLSWDCRVYFYKANTSDTSWIYDWRNNTSEWWYYNASNCLNTIVFSNVDIYDSSRTNILIHDEDYFKGQYYVPPSFLNYDDSNWGNSLVTGEFQNLFIDNNSGEDVRFYLYDITYGYDEYEVLYGSLNRSSPYFYLEDSSGMHFAIDKSLINYQDNHKYKLVIDYSINSIPQTGLVYEWTTSFSSSVVDSQTNSQLGDINQGISDMNGFLQDDSYNQSDIVDNMPNSDEYEAPTDDGINNIFTTLRNAFTSSTPISVRFVIPNTNGQYIDIPADLVTSKLPIAILLLIQSFYWFLICRFIIKDIANTADKAKSGDILDSNNDGNIKTELL